MTNITKVSQIKKLENATQLILLAEEGTRRNLYTIASTLAFVDKNKLYEEGDYKSTTEYGEAVFGYKRATTSALVRVAIRFLEGNNSTLKQEDQKDFTIYQLMELLPMEDKDIENALEQGELNPYMTTKAIRDLAKSYKILPEKVQEPDAEVKQEPDAEVKQEPDAEVKQEPDGSQSNQILQQIALSNINVVYEWLKLFNDASAMSAMDNLQEAKNALLKLSL